MRQHRPAYGNVFASLVNLHLLCTRVARRKADVDLMDAGAAGARLVWVVEVLADDNGVVGAAPQRVGDGEATAEAKGTPDGDRDGEGTPTEAKNQTGVNRTRWCREQRWGLVDVLATRIVDARI